jgi:7,8-dihydroneopterin aldolase/epimerase/oxygenase
MVMGTLAVTDIQCNAIIGILPHEREFPQPLVLGFSIELDISKSALSGQLSDSVDYAELTAKLKELAIVGRFELLETLVWTLATFVLKNYPLVQSVFITATKPQAIAGCSGPTATISLNSSELPTPCIA